MMTSYTIYKRCCKKPKTHTPIVNQEEETGEPALEMTVKNGKDRNTWKVCKGCLVDYFGIFEAFSSELNRETLSLRNVVSSCIVMVIC